MFQRIACCDCFFSDSISGRERLRLCGSHDTQPSVTSQGKDSLSPFRYLDNLSDKRSIRLSEFFSRVVVLFLSLPEASLCKQSVVYTNTFCSYLSHRKHSLRVYHEATYQIATTLRNRREPAPSRPPPPEPRIERAARTHIITPKLFELPHDA